MRRHHASGPVHRFPLIDVVRGVAALSIAFFHTYAKGDPATSKLGLVVERLAANLGVGVPIFFVISGFVLYRPWVAARAAGRPTPQTRAYAWRRFLRIVPAFYVAMLVGVVVFDQWGELFSSTGVASFAFAQIYTPDHVGLLGVAWSLDTEMAWYVLLPMLAVFAGRWAPCSRHGEWALPIAFLTTGLVLLLAYNMLSAPGWWGYLVPFWFAHFAAGMTLAVISVRDSAFARRAASRGGLCVLAAAAAYVVIALSDYLVIYETPAPSWITPLIDSSLGIVVAVGLLLPAIFDDGSRTGLRRWVGSRPAVYLGLISYGIFLYHGAAFHVADELGFPVYGARPGALIGFAFAIAMASLSWHLIERPALSLRRLVGRREPVEPTAAGAERPVVAELA